jgi:hypothetical protein
MRAGVVGGVLNFLTHLLKKTFSIYGTMLLSMRHRGAAERKDAVSRK